jgi:hypothetical protein
MNDNNRWDEILHTTISPIGSLDRIISRQTNLVKTAQLGKVFKYLRAEQANLNKLIKESLES